MQGIKGSIPAMQASANQVKEDTYFDTEKECAE